MIEKPLRIMKESVFRGFPLLTFMAAAALALVKKSLKKTGLTPMGLIEEFRTAKANVYESGGIVVCEGSKTIGEMMKTLKISYPKGVMTYRPEN
jgi:hypothetical protein